MKPSENLTRSTRRLPRVQCIYYRGVMLGLSMKIYSLFNITLQATLMECAAICSRHIPRKLEDEKRTLLLAQ
jgi:hypothetical protein